ncbi:stromal membrane-associated protein 1 isoform X3 [Fundulus heteroclitus]|uniref:stromal membrane-associated protein 1 isoform X3 n=1 Tax=Fundulus heteroclitus TaxID=8078 RepID=UPI00165B41E2|nr:stromal membrane-associated protein 1 isoform X3 [Fundulus heteroclitus]
MTTRSEREKAQKLNEQHQAILTKLLREEDNKYCADCEAKGPRWASWNLGVFMCIRCAGIHRNLGVHISRVKSVNLDQWTSEQIQSMVDMGNTRARKLYEAHLPENFRRPQTDQAVEVFIRDKYERKKYYDQEALAAASQSECRASPKKSPEPAVDLLGLDAPEGERKGSDQTAPAGNELDLFGPMVSNPLPPSNTKQDQPGSSAAPPQVDPPTTTTTPSSSSSTTTTAKVEEKKLLSKDSILSLYGSSSAVSQPQSQQQPAAGPGAYLGQPQMQFNQQGFPPAMGGGAPPTTVMGGGPGMPGMALLNGGHMGTQQPGGMAHHQGQQQQQQGQWQMTQQMSSMALTGGGLAAGAPTTGWSTSPAPASGQTLSTQLWK